MTVGQFEVTEATVEVVESVQDYIVGVEVSVTIKGFNQVSSHLDESDIDFIGDDLEFDGSNTILITRLNGEVKRVEFDGVTIKEVGNGDSILTGYFLMELDENETDIDAAFTKAVKALEGATIRPFMISYEDVPRDAVYVDGGTWDIEHVEKWVEVSSDDVKFDVSLQVNI